MLISYFKVPFMVAGQSVAIVGSALLTRLAVDTPTAVWATYLVVTGVGLGMGLQMPFTALQVVLRYDYPFALLLAWNIF